VDGCDVDVDDDGDHDDGDHDDGDHDDGDHDDGDHDDGDHDTRADDHSCADELGTHRDRERVVGEPGRRADGGQGDRRSGRRLAG
jgi:hypothetical protein